MSNGMKRIAGLSLMLAATIGLASCEKPGVKAPLDKGICYQVGFPESGDIKYNVVARNQPSIEYCAAQLYKLRLEFLKQGVSRKIVYGAYQGNFLFVDARYVKFSQALDGRRMTLLVKHPSEDRLVVPGSIVEAPSPQPSGPIREPANLPQ
ncbi:hypothetical protein OVA03_01445 [Asticcacaulis sp. SL142]|uniref:hypothetical protein n=1 Tax=Asticcacaulis sp. SL142 TaxID=2995155 RepID=UPI00226CE03C|nr:hypothetical protein [Asticcacaulis sp. SL142]WAC48628.1 hypothetical protein OVA03_01445 [Asticcacaulis sp. SL142]